MIYAVLGLLLTLILLLALVVAVGIARADFQRYLDDMDK